MGNRIGGVGRRRGGSAVEERHTRPQGLYDHSDIDHRKLKKLILDGKLAPCCPGADDPEPLLEECPICFLYYPSLNRSKCCTKGICTECFLQMKPSHSARSTQCPFCKTPNYAVEFRGVKTKEERCMEQVEEQRVIEAQIRIRQQEIQEEEEKMKRKEDKCSSHRKVVQKEVEYRDICSNKLSVPAYRCTAHESSFDPSEPSCSSQVSIRPAHSRHNRDANADLGLEEIMVMEAVWRSVQEQGNLGQPTWGGYFPTGLICPERHNFHQLPQADAHPTGFAYAFAGLPGSHPQNVDYPHIAYNNAPVFDMLRRPGSMAGSSICATDGSLLDTWTGVPPYCRREATREDGDCSADHWSDAADAGTSYSGSEIMTDALAVPLPLPFSESFQMPPAHILPESIEDHMMLSMAVSLAEARSRMQAPGLAWL